MENTKFSRREKARLRHNRGTVNYFLKLASLYNPEKGEEKENSSDTNLPVWVQVKVNLDVNHSTVKGPSVVEAGSSSSVTKPHAGLQPARQKKKTPRKALAPSRQLRRRLRAEKYDILVNCWRERWEGKEKEKYSNFLFGRRATDAEFAHFRERTRTIVSTLAALKRGRVMSVKPGFMKKFVQYKDNGVKGVKASPVPLDLFQ